MSQETLNFVVMHVTPSAQHKFWQVYTLDGKTLLGQIQWLNTVSGYVFIPAKEYYSQARLYKETIDTFCVARTKFEQKDKIKDDTATKTDDPT